MNNQLDDIIVELEFLASESGEDFKNKFWANYEKYLNKYNELLTQIHTIGLYKNVPKIQEVPNGQKGAFGKIGTQSEQAKLREISNSSQILLQKLKKHTKKSKIKNIFSKKKVGILVDNLHYLLTQNKPLVIILIIISLLAAIIPIVGFIDQNKTNDDYFNESSTTPAQNITPTNSQFLTSTEVSVQKPTIVNITCPLEEAFIGTELETEIRGNISQPLEKGEYMWIVLGLDGWYPQEKAIIPNKNEWSGIAYIDGPSIGTKIEIAVLIVNDNLNSKFNNYMKEQDPDQYKPYDNNTEIEQNIKAIVKPIFKGYNS